MSLLEDVFLEDEAGEAQELERIIEGDEFDERPPARSDSDDNSEREDEAEEEKRRVDPSSTKTRTRVTKNPRFILNPARLTGPRGIQVIPDHFKDFKFRGKGYEKDDLDLVLKKLEHWAYRLYPKFKFEDCLKKIETLGKKRPVMVHLHKIRSDQFVSEETVVQRDSSDDEAQPETPPEDEFDKLLQQQIDLARSTPAPQASNKGMDSAVKENRSLIMPKATSSPSITEEQRERILRSKRLAEERRLAKLKNMNTVQNSNITLYTPCKGNLTLLEKISENENEANTLNNNSESASSHKEIVEITSFQKVDTPASVSNINEINKLNIINTENIFSIKENDVGKTKKKVRANIIDSSDEDDDNIVVMNKSIRVDVHTNYDEKDDDRNDQTIMKQDLRNDKHSIDNDVIEMDDNSKDKKNNDLNNCQKIDISINNNHNEKCNSNHERDILEKDLSEHEDKNYDRNITQRFHNVDRHENDQSETDFVNDSEKDNNDKTCNNLDFNDKEIEPELILSKINTNSVSSNDIDVEADKKTPKASNLQETEGIKDCVEGKRQDSTNVPEKAVVDTVEELMDVDFDDDF